jgi:hypothetical protein
MALSTHTGSHVDREKYPDQVPETGEVPDCIVITTNPDGTLDFSPLPLGLRNIWLFKNGGEKNDVH